tara:strand:+ start:45 stop:626 length:582 start_codon:yes stop_codon:yes gene_type:complete
MFGNKYSGNNIAQEYFDILAKNSIAKKAKVKKEAQEIEEMADDPVDSILNEKSEGDLLPNPESFLMSVVESRDDISEALDTNIQSMDSAGENADMLMADDYQLSETDYFDATAQHILNGLGKISGSLKAKGQGFASDIVQSTAMSIRDDFVKEAALKMEVVSELTKMSKELSKSGNQMAADMILITIGKIKKG